MGQEKKRFKFGDVLESGGNLTFELPEIKGQRSGGLCSLSVFRFQFVLCFLLLVSLSA